MKETRCRERRKFLRQLAMLSTGAVITPDLTNSFPLKVNTPNCIKEGLTILFQGDSITDGNRTRNNDWNHVMGHGYQYIIASRLGYDFPTKGFHFFNRGISGNKVSDLATRWQTDTLELKPGLLSILIGINDVSAFIHGDKNFAPAQYETGYRSLLEQTKHVFPDIKFVLCEPFILPVGKVKEQWKLYSEEIEQRREIVKKLSVEFDAIFVPFQDAFKKALTRAPAEYWIWDGIHPMPAGHELMAREWIYRVNKKLNFKTQ